MANKAKSIKVKNKQENKFFASLKKFMAKYGSTLLSNKACFNLKDSHWYIAVPVAIICVMLSVIPVSVTAWNQQGSQILASPKNGLDTGLVNFQNALYDNKIDINIDGETTHTATLPEASRKNWVEGTKEQGFYSVNGRTVYADKYTVTTDVKREEKEAEKKSKAVLKAKESDKKEESKDPVITIEEKTVDYYNLVVYDLTNLNQEAFHDEIWGENNTGKKKDGTLSILANKDIKGNNVYSVTTLFIGKDTFALARYPQGLKTRAYREFKYNCPNFNMKDLAVQDMNGDSYDINYHDLKPDTIDTYYAKSMAAWGELFDCGYNEQRIKFGWQNAGVWFGIYSAITFSLGLFFFLVTRGKNCINRDLTFWQAQKTAYFVAITPAILALCFGFTKPLYAQYAFIFFMIVRGLWMMSNTLNPKVVNEEEKK